VEISQQIITQDACCPNISRTIGQFSTRLSAVGSPNEVDLAASPLTPSSPLIPEMSTRNENATSAEQNNATSAEQDDATSAEQNVATSPEQLEESQSDTEQNLSSSDRETLDGSSIAPERILSAVRRYPKNFLLSIRNNLSVSNETIPFPQLKCFVPGLNENFLLIDIPMDKIGSLLGLRNSLTFIPSKLVKKCRKVHNFYLERIRDEPITPQFIGLSTTYFQLLCMLIYPQRVERTIFYRACSCWKWMTGRLSNWDP
jgi:hypothetical protein